VRAAAQLPDSTLRSIVLKGMILAAVFLAALYFVFTGVANAASRVLDMVGLHWSSTDVVMVLAAAFVPMATITVGFFVDPVAEAVERAHYPELSPVPPRPLLLDLGIALRYLFLTAAINLPMEPLYWIAPPIPALVNGYLMGREFFELAARRRYSALQTIRLRWRAMGVVWGAGALLAVLAIVPGVNLIVPVFGMALMTHVLHRTSGASGREGA